MVNIQLLLVIFQFLELLVMWIFQKNTVHIYHAVWQAAIGHNHVRCILGLLYTKAHWTDTNMTSANCDLYFVRRHNIFAKVVFASVTSHSLHNLPSKIVYLQFLSSSFCFPLELEYFIKPQKHYLSTQLSNRQFHSFFHCCAFQCAYCSSSEDIPKD